VSPFDDPTHRYYKQNECGKDVCDTCTQGRALARYAFRPLSILSRSHALAGTTNIAKDLMAHAEHIAKNSPDKAYYLRNRAQAIAVAGHLNHALYVADQGGHSLLDPDSRGHVRSALSALSKTTVRNPLHDPKA